MGNIYSTSRGRAQVQQHDVPISATQLRPVPAKVECLTCHVQTIPCADASGKHGCIGCTSFESADPCNIPILSNDQIQAVRRKLSGETTALECKFNELISELISLKFEEVNIRARRRRVNKILLKEGGEIGAMLQLLLHYVEEDARRISAKEKLYHDLILQLVGNLVQDPEYSGQGSIDSKDMSEPCELDSPDRSDPQEVLDEQQ